MSSFVVKIGSVGLLYTDAITRIERIYSPENHSMSLLVHIGKNTVFVAREGEPQAVLAAYASRSPSPVADNPMIGYLSCAFGSCFARTTCGKTLYACDDDSNPTLYSLLSMQHSLDSKK